jgi:hypothetical protein
MTIARRVKRITIAIVVLIVVFVAAVVAYVEYFYPHAGLLNLVRGVPPSASWQNHCYSSGDFCAKFPANPTVQAASSGTSYQTNISGLTNTVVVGAADLTKPPQQAVNAAIADTLSGSGFQVVGAATAVTLSGQMATEVNLKNNSGGGGRGIFLIAGRSLYEVTAIGPSSAALDASGFIASFHFIRVPE